MLEIIILHPNGQTEKDTISPHNMIEEEKWQLLPADEFLYRYLLRNTALKAYTEGLPDEEQKVLKFFGVTYWEPGMEEVLFDGTIYKVTNTESTINRNEAIRIRL